MRRSRGRKFQSPPSRPAEDAAGELLVRARRHARRGEQRRAWLTLRQACCLRSDDARIWALYAACSRRMNRLEEAEKAFAQALFLRERGRDEARAAVLRRLLQEIRSERCAA